MSEKKFKFPLWTTVMLVKSKECGEVIGRAEYADRQDNYLVRYVTGDKCQVEAWISEDALVSTI